MKAVIMSAALLALAVPAAAVAGHAAGDEAVFIKVGDKGKHKGKHKHKNRGWDDDDRHEEARAYREGYRQGQREAYNNQYYRPGQVQYGYQRGYYLPQQYRGYVIRDYNEYDLYAPQYGQQWVGVGQNAYLMEVASGLILQVLQGRYR
jgi:Ni/Co efflux regulator RcnB